LVTGNVGGKAMFAARGRLPKSDDGARLQSAMCQATKMQHHGYRRYWQT